MTPAVLTPTLQAPSDAAVKQALAPPSDVARRLATTTKKTAAKKVTKKTKKKAKKLPVCTKKDLKKKKSKRRKCRVVSVKPSARRPSPTGPVAAPPVGANNPDAWTQPGGVDARTDGLRAYAGPFGVAQATRLLYRGGFGPRPGQAEEFASLGLKGAVARLINPGGASLQGPAPSGDFLVGGQFAPEDRWGHGHLEWLDRCVRSTDQLGERMTLVLHDWVAMSADKCSAREMSNAIAKFRAGWRGSYRQLMQDMTIDPGMLNWLDGLGSSKWAPNENYGREIMEMFCLGADRGAYTEADIRELARALTGWVADWSDAEGLHNHRFDKTRWDSKEKVVFRGTSYERRGNLDYKDVVNAVVDHPLHPSFVALKLWSAFIPTPPTALTLSELEALYRSSGEQLGPLVEAILQHPDLYTGPSVTKSPITYVAGMLRTRNRGIDTDSWTWICGTAGQMLWFPPNVSGWNERAWLNTTTYAARWNAAVQHINPNDIDADSYKGVTETPTQAVEAALAFWNNPSITADHRANLDAMAVEATMTDYWAENVRKTMRQQALRMAVVASSDFQVS